MFRSIEFRLAWDLEDHIVTNYHVIQHTASIPLDFVHLKEVHTLNSEGVEETYIAEIVGTSLVTDLAVLKIFRSIGAGVVWDIEGHIVTNYYVIRPAASIPLDYMHLEVYALNFDRLEDTYIGEIVGASFVIDLALLKALLSETSHTLLPSLKWRFINVYKNIKTSVVTITSMPPKIKKQNSKFRSIGFRITWNFEGHIVTNYHVIQHTASIPLDYVHLKEVHTLNSEGVEETYIAEIPRTSFVTDLAVLKTPKNILKPITVEESTIIEIGQKCFLIGASRHCRHSLVSGTTSGLNRECCIKGQSPMNGMIQVDASTNPGISGAPLLNYSGRLIDIHRVGIPCGIGLSIPSSIVVETVTRFI